MSDTATPTTPATDVKASIVNQVIAGAKDGPTLLAGLQTVDPALVTALTTNGKALGLNPIGGIIAAGVAWLVTKYGLGWSPDVQTIVVGLIGLAGSEAVRVFKSSPFDGLLAKSAPAKAAAVSQAGTVG